MIVICLPYYGGDIQQATALAEMVAAIEPEKREDVRFRFVNRFDAPSMNADTIKRVGAKFDVSWDRTTTKATGWPAGPNAMVIDILTSAPRWLAANGWFDANGILIMEPDCVPMRRDWLNLILSQWNQAEAGGAWQMGHWADSGGPQGHINGNSVIRPDLAKKINLPMWCPNTLAWDVGIAPFARTCWCPTPVIVSHFAAAHAIEERLRMPNGELPAFVHGYKDDSCLNIARRLLDL